MDIITGIHSITHAIINPVRVIKSLFITEELWNELKSSALIPRPRINSIEVHLADQGKIQQLAQREFKIEEFEYKKVTPPAFLVCQPLEDKDFSFFRNKCKEKKMKICVLDQITDVHNLGAITRTAAFYGIDAIIQSSSKPLQMSPGFFKVASGGFEYVHHIRVANLSKCLSIMENEIGVATYLLDEKGNHPWPSREKIRDQSFAVVMGAEGSGASHAVKRIVSKHLSLQSQGHINSLNVSVAAAITFEKLAGI